MLFKLIAAFALIGLVAGRAHTPNSQFDKMATMYKSECNKYSDVKLEVIEARLNSTSECFKPEIDDETRLLILKAQIFMDEENIVAAVRNLCTKKEKLAICFDDVMEVLNSCIEPKLRNRMDDAKKALRDFGNYVCENDAEIIRKMLRTDELNCFEANNRLNQITQCAAPINALDLETISTTTRCTEYYTARDCFMGVVRQCPTHTYADFFEKLFDTFVVGSPCENRSVISNDVELTGRGLDRKNVTFERIHGRFVDECTKYGSPDKANKVEVKFITFENCLLAEIGMETLNVLNHATPDETPAVMLNLTENLCAKKKQLMENSCVFDLIDTTLPCVDPASKEKVDVFKKAFRNFVDYVCDNRTTVIDSSLDAETIRCVDGKQQQIRNCLNTHDLIEEALLPAPTSEWCKHYNDIEKCLVDELKQCRSQGPAEFVERLLNTLVAGSICDGTTISVNKI